MQNHQFNSGIPTNVLASLRTLVPRRPVSVNEGLRIAELQASRLLELWQIDDGPVPEEVVTELPRIQVVRQRSLVVSGGSHWNGHAWIITLNRDEPMTRQRFTLFHEFKHVIDHGYADRLYPRGGDLAEQDAEHAADYFAGCALAPKRLLKRAWGNGMQTADKLGWQFGLSTRAVDVRLAQTGLTLDRPRCAPPSSRPPRYTRATIPNPLEYAHESDR